MSASTTVSVSLLATLTIPVSRHRPILSLGRPLADRHRVRDPAMIGPLLRVVARATHHAAVSQMLQQLLFQGPAGLDEQRAVDGLVGHLARLVLRVPALEPPS